MFVNVLSSCEIIRLPLKIYLSCKNKSKQKSEVLVYISKSYNAGYFKNILNMLIVMIETCYYDSFIALVDIYSPVRAINCHNAKNALFFINFFCFIRKCWFNMNK